MLGRKYLQACAGLLVQCVSGDDGCDGLESVHVFQALVMLNAISPADVKMEKGNG